MSSPSHDPNKSKTEELKEKFKQSVESLKKNEKVEDLVNYASTNTRDLVAYALVIVGLLLMFFDPSWFGATLIGVILGLYFSDEIAAFFRGYRGMIERLGTLRSLILGAAFFAIFISSPFLFIGAGVAVALREVIHTESKEK